MGGNTEKTDIPDHTSGQETTPCWPTGRKDTGGKSRKNLSGLMRKGSRATSNHRNGAKIDFGHCPRRAPAARRGGERKEKEKEDWKSENLGERLCSAPYFAARPLPKPLVEIRKSRKRAGLEKKKGEAQR